MKFLRNLSASILGFFIASFICLIMFIGVASAISSEGDTIVVPNNAVLDLYFDGEVKDYSPKKDDLFSLLSGNNKVLGMDQILTAISNAKDDSRIKGISITGSVNAGISQLKNIRDALKDFKTSGKFIYSYSSYYTQKNYYLSSVADTVSLHSFGQVDLKGLSAEFLYWKDFEDKYGVKMEIIRHGKYKSAVEPYLRNKISKENEFQTRELLNSLWVNMTKDISESRGISKVEIDDIANNSLGRNANLSLENKLVDDIIHLDEYEKRLDIATKGTAKKISLADYIGSGKGRKYKKAKGVVAVLYAQGKITNGYGDENTIGSEMIIKALRKIVKNKSVSAIVLRINSPGGSAMASELIWRELEITKQSLPIVASIGNLGASGGYYIACNAERIVAEPMSITGSIGVFGAIPNFSGLTKKIGINYQRVSTNTSPYYSPFEEANSKFKDVTKQGVEFIYKQFVNRVSLGRGMSEKMVDEIAQGRVWTGEQAKENGLIDELGSLSLAIEIAAKLGGVEDDYKIKNYPKYPTKDFEDILEGIPMMSTKEEFIIEEIGIENYNIIKQIKSINSMKGIQARLPYSVRVN